MYQKMYIILFNAISAALEELPKGECTAAARFRLAEAQRQTENMFMDWDWKNGEPEG